jgi:PAS domain S-box-containing protein
LTQGDPLSERALILTPNGRDGEVAAAILHAGGFHAEVHQNLAAVCEEMRKGAGLAIIADEAIVTADLRQVIAFLTEQPAWSDFPIVLMTRSGGGPERNPAAARIGEVLGNVIFIERPFHPTTLISVVRTAMRGRRRQYEARLRLEDLSEGEERLRTALIAGHLGSWLLEISPRILYASKICKTHFGRTADDYFTYEDLLESIHHGDRERVLESVKAAIHGGADYVIEYRNIWPDGTIHWVDVRGRALRNTAGEVIQLAGVSSDVTERKDADLERDQLLEDLAEEQSALSRLTASLEKRVVDRTEQLQSSETRLRAIFESSYQFQGLLSPEGMIVDANAISLEAIEAKLSDIIGKPFWEAGWFSFTPDMPERVRAATAAVAQGQVVRQELRINLPRGGWRWFDFTLRPLMDNNGAVIGIVPEAAELTDRRRAEEALRQAQKMEAIGQLTGGVAHDFNNLLMAVMGNLDLLQKHLSEDTRSQRLIDGALQGAKRGAALTQRMLAFARQQDLKTTIVDLNALLLGMQDLLDRTLGPQVISVLELPENITAAKLDVNQIELVILNLTINARDAMPNGGTITISLDTNCAEIPTLLPMGMYARIRVADTGVGMNAETLKRAADPFFSTKAIGKGTGLGLSMVQGVVAQLGGSLELFSKVGKGTVATIWLPIINNSEIEARPAVSAANAPSLSRTATILVVDDDMLISMATVEMLEDLGHTVLEANSGSAALQILDSGKSIDLMMTDHAMPGMTGMELAEKVRSKWPDLPILLATGYADLPSDITLVLPRLSKPYMQIQLKAEIDKLLAT